MSNEQILILDTSTSTGSVALCRGEHLLAEIVVDSLASHSDKLLMHVEQILEEQTCRLADIAAFAVIDGPGSFTGLRVGVAAAKGLAHACQRPLFGVSSLHLLAAGLPFASMPVCALIDARKKEVYSATFSTVTGSPVLLDAPQVVPPQRYLEEMTSPALFVGSGAVLYRDLIDDRFGLQATVAPWTFHTPRASMAAPIVLQLLREGATGDSRTLLPRYIRPSDAEIAQKKA